MKDYQVRAMNTATPGLPQGEKLGDMLNAIQSRLGANDVAISVGAEDTNAIAVAVQALDADGKNVSGSRNVFWWLSDTAGGAATGTPPATSTAVSKGTSLNVFTAKVSGQALTNTDGVLELTITETGAATWYLNVSVDGVVATSGAITFVGE